MSWQSETPAWWQMQLCMHSWKEHVEAIKEYSHVIRPLGAQALWRVDGNIIWVEKYRPAWFHVTWSAIHELPDVCAFVRFFADHSVCMFFSQ